MKPDFAIREEHDEDGTRIIFIDTTKATYQGLPWKELGDFGKRKFENVLFLERQPTKLSIRYV